MIKYKIIIAFFFIIAIGACKQDDKFISGTSRLKIIYLAALTYEHKTGKKPFQTAKNFNNLVTLLALDKTRLFEDGYSYTLAKNAPFILKKKNNASAVLILFINGEPLLVLYEYGFVRKMEESDKIMPLGK